MTEKSYGGNNGVREHSNKGVKAKPIKLEVARVPVKVKKSDEEQSSKKTKHTELDDYIKAGKISIEVKKYAREIIKPGMTLLEIARKIEAKIYELGGVPAFPVNLSIDDIAAHYHPTIEDTKIAEGLLKVDLGIHINGLIADTAFTLDLTPDKKHTELIKATEEALESAFNTLDKNPTINDIGEAISNSIEKKGFSPITNLSGHGLGEYNIHEGITIPNYANGNNKKLESGAYAIEPFGTYGEGKIYEGPASNIFAIINFKNPRGPTARKILEYVGDKYRTLPFSLREIQEKFGPMARLGMKELVDMGILHSFPQLIEVSHKAVAQAENSFVKTREGQIVVTTRE